jgi:hypothetical protein
VEVQDMIDDIIRNGDSDSRKILLIRFWEGHISDQEMSDRLGITRRMVQLRRQSLKDTFYALERQAASQKRARGRPRKTA